MRLLGMFIVLYGGLSGFLRNKTQKKIHQNKYMFFPLVVFNFNTTMIKMERPIFKFI